MVTRTFLPGVLAIAIGVSVVAGADQADQGGANWTAPRTPWGDPDIQGIFTTDDELGVPFERPEEFGQRTLLTDEELAEREAQSRRQADPDLPDVFEYACHEGNYAMRNILSAAREADRAGQATGGR